MKRTILSAAVFFSLTGIAAAQTKTLTGEMKTATATVESIERATRTVVLKAENGVYTTVEVPLSVTKFDAMKVGDKVTAKYYDNIVLRLKPAGEKAVDTDAAGITRAGGAKPAGTASTQRTITATITQIDMKVPSITFKGPNNWTYSSRVEDIDALKKVKVGDRMDITWTEAVMVSVEAPGK
jgi:hypothetical protein